jgi:hypothetical protein
MLQNLMKTNIGVLCLSIAILLFGCNRNQSSYSESFSNDPVDYSRSEEDVREDLGTREARNPASYLSFDGTYRKNLLGEIVIEGTISNSASIATFKDAVLHVTGYSKTETKIGTWEETIYEVFKPGNHKQIKAKMLLPSTVKTIGVEVFDATSL